MKSIFISGQIINIGYRFGKGEASQTGASVKRAHSITLKFLFKKIFFKLLQSENAKWPRLLTLLEIVIVVCTGYIVSI